MKTQIYNQKGEVVREINLPENIFGLEFNNDLVSQVLYIQGSNRRSGIAHTKDRGEVSGSNAKPWRQKGTGRARHGSKRSPLWRHGGTTHGPRNTKSYKKDLPKNMRNKALFSLLSAKLKDGKILFLENLNLESPKTKDANILINNLSAKVKNFENLSFKKKNNVYLTLPKLDLNSRRAFRNLPNISAHNLEDLNPLDVANVRYMIITDIEKTLEYLNSKLK